MQVVYIYGSGRDASTRMLRKQQSVRRRQVRFGPNGEFVVRHGRRIAINTDRMDDDLLAELAELHGRGLVQFEDGSRNKLDVQEVTGKLGTQSRPEPAPKDQKPQEVSKEQKPEAETETEAETGDELPETDPPGSEIPYGEWDYNDLRAEVANRELEPESWKKADLVQLLSDHDEIMSEE